MNTLLEKISALGLIPVIKLDDAKKAAPLARALSDGGLPVAEITFRTSAAEEAIRMAVREMPDMLVGAGTVLSVEQAKRALGAGAKFIVSPAFNEGVVRFALDAGVPVLPGCSSPSDIDRAVSMGLDCVKFFPSEQLGGLKTIKAIAAPYSGVMFVPTGGITQKNIADYMCYDRILACGGSYMAPADKLKADDYAGITALVRESVDAMLGLSLSAEAAVCAARGEGVVRVGANSVFRAIEHMANMGMEFDEATRVKNGAGRTVSIRTKPICGRVTELYERRA